MFGKQENVLNIDTTITLSNFRYIVILKTYYLT